MEIIISDNGIGINENDLIHVFEPFFRASNASEIKGSGLGLTLTKKCVEIYNGEINIKSKLGSGTNVFVKLPSISNIYSYVI